MASRPLFDMFNRVTPRYDLLNRLMSLGLDQLWRRRAARECLAGGPARVLDLCCGTGDLTGLLADMAGEKTTVMGADFSAPMIAAARSKVQVPFLLADAGALPFPDGSLDVVSLSFAFRNLTYENPRRSRALAEIQRVLKPGGRLVAVELAQPSCFLVRWPFHLYLWLWVGLVGGAVSRRWSAYQYLSRSARHFFTPHEIARFLGEAGFGPVDHIPLFFGSGAVTVGTKALPAGESP